MVRLREVIVERDEVVAKIRELQTTQRDLEDHIKTELISNRMPEFLFINWSLLKMRFLVS